MDEAKLHQFVGQMLNDLGGAVSIALVQIGDALGLYKTLHRKGPMTTHELAAEAGVNERYLREWASHHAASNYLTYDSATQKFTLPPEQAMVFAVDDSPVNMIGAFGCMTSFAVWCGVGLCFGYALLGACWLVRKFDGEIRSHAHRAISIFATAVSVFLVAVFLHALIKHLPIMHRWIDRPYLFVFPAIGGLAAWVLARSILRHDDRWPFYMVTLIFVSAFGTLALSFWPYMIPFAITIDSGAAPHSSLAFMFWGAGIFVYPLMLLYAVVGYRVFRGKLELTADHQTPAMPTFEAIVKALSNDN